MQANLKAIAEQRGIGYADRLTTFYRVNKHRGDIVVGIAQDPERSWLSVADPELYKMIARCLQPYCTHCNAIVVPHTAFINKNTTRSYCLHCETEIEWRHYHSAELAEDAFWDAVEITLAGHGMKLHGDDEDERYFYICTLDR